MNVCVCVCLAVWLRVCCVYVCVCERERERELTPSTPHETLRGKYIIHRAGVMDNRVTLCSIVGLFYIIVGLFCLIAGVMDNLVTLCSTYMLCVADRDSLW